MKGGGEVGMTEEGEGIGVLGEGQSGFGRLGERGEGQSG